MYEVDGIRFNTLYDLFRYFVVDLECNTSFELFKEGKHIGNLSFKSLEAELATYSKGELSLNCGYLFITYNAYGMLQNFCNICKKDELDILLVYAIRNNNNIAKKILEEEGAELSLKEFVNFASKHIHEKEASEDLKKNPDLLIKCVMYLLTKDQERS